MRFRNARCCDILLEHCMQLAFGTGDCKFVIELRTGTHEKIICKCLHHARRNKIRKCFKVGVENSDDIVVLYNN